MSISVVDQAGNLGAHATMDGTQYAAIDISQAKARTAALYRRATGVFQAAVNTGGSPSTLSLLALTHGVASEGVSYRLGRKVDRGDRGERGDLHAGCGDGAGGAGGVGREVVGLGWVCRVADPKDFV